MPQAEAMQPDHSGNTTYISPSDTIMSPTTKKLSEMKGKRFASAKPQSLFAQTVGKQALKGQNQGQGQGQGQGQDQDQAQGQDEEKADDESGPDERDQEQQRRL